MSTRSIIGVMHGDNCKAVYCHFDGYLSHNGRILQEHYDSPKANNLIALGNISSLAPNIGEKHPFEPTHDMHPKLWERKYGNMTTFYGRDREEEGQEFKTYTSKESLVEHFNNVWAEFCYIMKDGVWYMFDQDNTELRLLSEELAKVTEEV
jgi:hypothetical protein